jgi:hypothetical protein
MSKKPRAKSKRQRQKQEPRAQPPMFPTTRSDSNKHTLLLTVLGLVLTMLGLIALVELFPRPSVSASSPTDRNLWLTSRFTVTNDGYLQLNDVQAVCFIWKATTRRNRLFNNASKVIYSPNEIFPTGQSFTVPCEDDNVHIITGPYTSADLAIVVSYRPWPFTFTHRRKFFRFVARLGDGNVIWDKQPSLPLEHDFDELMKLNSNPNFKAFR